MVLFVGYARTSSMGRKLVDGAKEVEIFKNPYRCFAASNISILSTRRPNATSVIYLTYQQTNQKYLCHHGDPEAAKTFATLAQDTVGLHASVPMLGDVIELT